MPSCQAVALELGRYKREQLGAGLVFRVARELQREFLRMPATSADDAM
jgi:hypothetical protein